MTSQPEKQYTYCPISQIVKVITGAQIGGWGVVGGNDLRKSEKCALTL